MPVPQDRKYTREHEWAKREDGRVRVGITDYAQRQLGDIVYVELPKPGAAVQAMKAFGVVESVKAASDLFAPVDGRIVEANAELESQPELVNSDPYDQGWMVVVEPTDASALDALLAPSEYVALIART